MRLRLRTALLILAPSLPLAALLWLMAPELIFRFTGGALQAPPSAVGKWLEAQAGGN